MTAVWMISRLVGPPSILSLSRKPLNFHNLPEHVDQLLQVDSEDEESQGKRHSLAWVYKYGAKSWGSLLNSHLPRL